MLRQTENVPVGGGGLAEIGIYKYYIYIVNLILEPLRDAEERAEAVDLE